jgi:hypothetical protein
VLVWEAGLLGVDGFEVGPAVDAFVPAFLVLWLDGIGLHAGGAGQTASQNQCCRGGEDQFGHGLASFLLL